MRGVDEQCCCEHMQVCACVCACVGRVGRLFLEGYVCACAHKIQSVSKHDASGHTRVFASDWACVIDCVLVRVWMVCSGSV